MIRAALAALLGLAFSVCASTPPADPRRAAWTADWNTRLDAAQTDFQHPCATRPFLVWADDFLVACDPDTSAAVSPECEARMSWVGERVEQCREWTQWQLRNFGRHERIEGQAPSMRVE